MILIKRTLPAIIGVITFLGLLAIATWQTQVWMWLLGVLLVSILGLGSLAGWGADLERWGLIAVTPALFLSSSVAFMLFIETQWLLIVIAVIVAVFVGLFLEHVFRFVHVPGIYQPYALEHTSIVLHIASIYFFTTMFYGLHTFLLTPVWLISLIFFLLAALFVYETLWVSKVASKTASHIALLGALVLTQLFAAVAFMPTSFFVNAAIVSVGFYVFLGVIRTSLLQRLSGVALRRYTIAGGLFLLVILFSAKWI
jgi:hypothetical protein